MCVSQAIQLGNVICVGDLTEAPSILYLKKIWNIKKIILCIEIELFYLCNLRIFVTRHIHRYAPTGTFKLIFVRAIDVAIWVFVNNIIYIYVNI